MGALGPGDEQTVEEIRASIRRMVLDANSQPLTSSGFESSVVHVTEPASDIAKTLTNKPQVKLGGATPVEVVEQAVVEAIEDIGSGVPAEARAVPMTNLAEQLAPGASSAMIAKARLTGVATSSIPLSDTPVVNATITDVAGAYSMAVDEGVSPVVEPQGRSAPLLSPDTEALVSNAFRELATTMLLPVGTRTIDDLIEEILRPILQNWLDLNLPVLVERLVREELERLSRTSRVR